VQVVTYEVALTNPARLDAVRKARRAIEADGGVVIIEPPTKTGVTLVTLRLTAPHVPDEYLPGIPFTRAW